MAPKGYLQWSCVALASAAALAQPSDPSSRISHIVVLMMENRSFDHLLGWLKSKLSPGINGLLEGQTTPRDPRDASKGSLPITRDGYDISPDDPKHGFNDIAVQINGNAMDGFVYDSISTGLNESNPVSMFDITTAPIINTLALEYAVFDSWYCSIPGPTDPNRQFAMSGTSRGWTTNFNGTLYPQQTYMDYLREHNRTFAGYYQDDLWALGYFTDLLKPENSRFVKEMEPNFFDDAAAGNLPHFTWLQPRSSSDSGKVPTWQHPDASVLEGERLIKQVYEALRASPTWESTLLLITYDEHGGFYDHVTPPFEGVSAPDEYVADNGFAFDRLGVRIPTVAISPWIAKGTIVSDGLPNEMPTTTSAFDATSTLATSNILLGLKDAAPLSDRMAWSNTFAGIFNTLNEPRLDCPMTLAELPETPPSANAQQRAKPLNEHLEGQLLFYCVMNYPQLHAQGLCPCRPDAVRTQGDASDWLVKESRTFKAKQLTGQIFPSI